MRALPFPCIRPADDHVIEVVSEEIDVLASADALRAALAEGTLVKDPGAAYYLYQYAAGESSALGIVCICALDDLAAAELAPDERIEERSARLAGRISATRVQAEPVVATYADEPVLNMILGAAMQGTPLYRLVDGVGAHHRAWEIKRREAVDAIHTMLEGTAPLRVETPAALAAAEAEREMRATLQARTGEPATGKEPFNYALCALFPAGSAIPAELPHALFLHQVAKL